MCEKGHCIVAMWRNGKHVNVCINSLSQALSVCELYGHVYERCGCDFQRDCPMFICRDCEDEYEGDE